MGGEPDLSGSNIGMKISILMTIEDSRFKNAKMVQQDLSMNLLNFILCSKLKMLKFSVFLATWEAKQ